MNFYNLIFVTTIIFTFLHKSDTNTNGDLIYTESGVITPSPLTIGLIFFVKINNTSDRNDYGVEITPDECCLRDGDQLDCDSLQILGGCTDFIPKGETKKLKVIAPLLNQYEREGHCVLYVDSKSNNGQNERDIIKINFDTALHENKFDFLDNFKQCENSDEDSFDDCNRIICDVYYNGKKTHFSRKLKRCVQAPACVNDDDYIYPSTIYNPTTNQCNEESILKEDLDYVKSLSKDNESRRKVKNVISINKFPPNTTEFMKQNVLIDDIVSTTTCKQESTKLTNQVVFNLLKPMKSHKQKDRLKSFFKKYFIDNKWTLMILIIVVMVQCILICTMLYCFSKTCNCCEDKRVIRKFFNYRQDASVTTPLIDTSNVDTETTEYQYSESSNNINKKIKCYKACQREQNNNINKSISDDILSKCVNRRDWKKLKSEVIAEPKNYIGIMKNDAEIAQANQSLVNSEDKKLSNEIKVVFEDEKTITDNKRARSVNRESNLEIFTEMKDTQNVETNLSSEKEIKCHSYNRFDADVTGFRAHLAKNTNVFKGGTPQKHKHKYYSTEKGAQAYFSNDSIDDLLSERGVTYLAGENISKYTFSNGSNDIKPTSSVSSKTSNKFVKNMLSMLCKRSKRSLSSDPGQNKDIDVKLIHMSRASVYSSTNESDCLKTLKRQDSRTSF